MKRTKFFYCLLVSALLTALSISCKEPVAITGVKLDKTELLLPIKGTATLTANVLPYSATDKMTWTTNNDNVVAVENKNTEGSVSRSVLTAKSAGTAIITVSTKDGKQSTTCTVTVVNPEPELISVEGGTFTMGDTDGLGFPHDFPPHQVTLSSYKIAKYTVTQQQWEAVMGTNPSHFQGNDLPAESITWYQAQEFITKLNELTGKSYRLPTEAEWEYAARGGNKSKGYKYSGSDDVDAVAWYRTNSGTVTHPVGKKAPNELGIYDMSGNVFEWCSDWYGDYPTPPETGTRRVSRGGGYLDYEMFSRVYTRISTAPGSVYYDTGFRLVHP